MGWSDLGGCRCSDRCFPSSASGPPCPPWDWGRRGNVSGSVSGEGWGARPLHPCSASCGWQRLLLAWQFIVMRRGACCFCPPLWGEGGRWLLSSLAVIVWPRSGVWGQGAVQSTRCIGGSWSKGKWGLDSAHCGCQASRRRASFLENGLQTWEDPLILGFDSRAKPTRLASPQLCSLRPPQEHLESPVSPLDLEPLSDPSVGQGAARPSDSVLGAQQFLLRDWARETWREVATLGLLVCDLVCTSGVTLLCVSPLMVAELCGHMGVPSPSIACFRAQATLHGKAAVLTQSRGRWITLGSLLELLLMCFSWATRMWVAVRSS